MLIIMENGQKNSIYTIISNSYALFRGVPIYYKNLDNAVFCAYYGNYDAASYFGKNKKGSKGFSKETVPQHQDQKNINFYASGG